MKLFDGHGNIADDSVILLPYFHWLDLEFLIDSSAVSRFGFSRMKISLKTGKLADWIKRAS